MIQQQTKSSMEGQAVEEAEYNEVEMELIKMTSVSRDIRIVIENILDAKELDRKVDKELIKTFTIELQSILENIQTFPAKSKKRPSFKVGEKITEAQEEEENSEGTIKSFGLQFQNSKAGRQSLDINQLYDINQELTEENEFLTAKLEEAEEYIKKIEEEQSKLEEQLSGMRVNTNLSTKPSKNDLGWRSNSNQYFETQEGLTAELMNENEELRQELEDSKNFILKNNQDFVRELQKYNEKIWRLQRDVNESANMIQNYEIKIEEHELIISKLKEDNFNLEIASRNYRKYTNTDRSMRQSNNWNQEERKHQSQVYKLKNIFRREMGGGSTKNI